MSVVERLKKFPFPKDSFISSFVFFFSQLVFLFSVLFPFLSFSFHNFFSLLPFSFVSLSVSLFVMRLPSFSFYFFSFFLSLSHFFSFFFLSLFSFLFFPFSHYCFSQLYIPNFLRNFRLCYFNLLLMIFHLFLLKFSNNPTNNNRLFHYLLIHCSFLLVFPKVLVCKFLN